jgi:copper chaperone CopZ
VNVKRVLARLEGIASVAVDVKGKEIRVEYDEARVTPEDIRRAVERADVRKSVMHRVREIARHLRIWPRL